MASSAFVAAAVLVCAMLFHTCPSPCVQDQPITMTYHKGVLLSGCIVVNLIWYSNFSPKQRVVINDFVSSLSMALEPQPESSVTTWFKTAQKYYANSKARFPSLVIKSQVLDQSYSLSKRRR